MHDTSQPKKEKNSATTTANTAVRFLKLIQPKFQPSLLSNLIKQTQFCLAFASRLLQRSANPSLSLATALCLLLPVIVSATPAQLQNPPKQIDLSKFPAAAVDDVVVPVPSEIFNVLDKLGTPNWREEMRQTSSHNTGNRAQIALLLGTIIADGFIAVEAQDVERVKNIGRDVLTLAGAINVQDAVISRSKSIVDKAEEQNWQAVRYEFDGALQDVRGAMEELNDDDLAQLVSLGGWIRGTEALTSIVQKDYQPQRAQLLHQPELVLFFNRRIDSMSPRLRQEALVMQIRQALDQIHPLVGKSTDNNIPLDRVKQIHQMTNNLVASITSEGV